MLLGLLGVLLVALGLTNPADRPAPAADLAAATPTSAPSDGSASAPPPSPTPAESVSASRSAPSAAPSAVPSRSAARKTPRLTESAPTRVRIESAGVDAATVKLGIGVGGAMETPRDPDDVGWFVGAHTPGGPGTAVLAGHVTWNGRQTVFFDLGRLDKGTKVKVDRADGSTATFAITRRATVGKDEFPTAEVYRAGSTPELVMITCGGEYDVDRRYYDSNVIVWADLVSVSA